MSRNSPQSALFPSFILVLLMACCGSRRTACDNLVYKEEGLTRTEYLPCAGAMIAALDKTEAQLAAYFGGDQSARGQAVTELRRLQTLMKKAGGQKLLAGWADESLNSMNVDIDNAAGNYELCLMPFHDPDQFSRGQRAHHAAKAQYENMQ
jgi:hypothetical protein